MSNRLCPRCQQEYDSALESCPYCSVALGQPLPKEQARPKGPARPKVSVPAPEEDEPQGHDDEPSTLSRPGHHVGDPKHRPAGQRPTVPPPQEAEPEPEQPPAPVREPAGPFGEAAEPPAAAEIFGQEKETQGPVEREPSEEPTGHGEEMVEEPIEEPVQEKEPRRPSRRAEPGGPEQRRKSGAGRLVLASLGGLLVGGGLCFGLMAAGVVEPPGKRSDEGGDKAALDALAEAGVKDAPTPVDGIKRLAAARDQANKEGLEAKDRIKTLAAARDQANKEALEAKLASAAQLSRDEIRKLPPEAQKDPRIVAAVARDDFKTLLKEPGDKLDSKNVKVQKLLKDLEECEKGNKGPVTLEALRARVWIHTLLEEWDEVQKLCAKGQQEYPEAAEEFKMKAESARDAKGT